MPLVLRSTKEMLTHADLDGNFEYLLANLSGSTINIVGDRIISSGFLIHSGEAHIGTLIGSLQGTATDAILAQSSINAQTASYIKIAESASYVERVANADYAAIALNAHTSSYINPLNQTLIVNGNLEITGSVIFKNDIIIDGFTIGRGNGGHASNLAFGFNTLSNNTGTYNLAIGFQSLMLNTSGYNNVSIGPNTMKSNIGGSHNTVLGFNAGTEIVNGHNNTIIGNTPGFDVYNNIILSDGAGNIKYRWDGNTNNVYGSLTLPTSTAILSQVSSSYNFSNDEEAASGGIPLGGLYHNSGTIKIRLV